MVKTTWTQAQVDYLVSAYKADIPNTTIAAALGKTRKAVEQKAARLGITDKAKRNKNNSARLKEAHKEDTKFRRAFDKAVARRRQQAVPEELRPLIRKLSRCGVPADQRTKIIRDEIRKHQNANSRS